MSCGWLSYGTRWISVASDWLIITCYGAMQYGPHLGHYHLFNHKIKYKLLSMGPHLYSNKKSSGYNVYKINFFTVIDSPAQMYFCYLR